MRERERERVTSILLHNGWGAQALPLVVLKCTYAHTEGGFPHVSTTVQTSHIAPPTLNVDLITERTGLSRTLHGEHDVHLKQW